MTFPLNEVEPADIHLLTGMLDTMADHVFSLRAEAGRYRLIYCNKAMDRFMNQADAMLCGRFLDEIVPDRDLYQRIADNYARARIAGHMIRYEETTEGFDSAPLTIFETSISPLTGRDGETAYICGISRDITARRNAEIALQKANERLEQQLAENRRLQQKLREEAIRDPLTNLFNRRYFLESLAREMNRAERGGYPVTLMMVDIDHFKCLNDDYGHSIGDQVLIQFSRQLCYGMRKGDVVCRWGGEEFLVMMPGISLNDSYRRMTDWRRQYSPMKFKAGGQELAIRFSSGLATAPEHGFSPDELIDAADNALYRAKASGRDQLQMPGQPEPRQ
ncbi:sensor domain-containing diguanylate cyclase [Marinobacter sp. Arc7-DN-1]|uniref:sensor domain-containing diguanylate cyclase n=1 Tax=Marinobacter sp. Arc7-DN-1 TaxID=2304594 RepID=UPI000E436C49|nr:sensor domain-containing diguanylate cyclase [Marinobacter sp. Arc7-DN-1]AXS84801.1 sensor domain-containing diguanylate cyclase [Marinobacter sp. Arc7-DN-1]